MKIFILTLITGVVFGVIDILPMLKIKLDKQAILSAFVFYLVVPFVVWRNTRNQHLRVGSGGFTA